MLKLGAESRDMIVRLHMIKGVKGCYGELYARDYGYTFVAE